MYLPNIFKSEDYNLLKQIINDNAFSSLITSKDKIRSTKSMMLLTEINDNDFQQYGEWLYWITIMGEPSATEPWGWQMDGHHLIINYFVLGDQVVMTPFFVGSEPVIAETGKYKGISILQDEQNMGLNFFMTLSEKQKKENLIKIKKCIYLVETPRLIWKILAVSS